MSSLSRFTGFVCASVLLIAPAAHAQSCDSSLHLGYDNVTGFVSGTMSVATECPGASYSWQVDGTNIHGGGSCAGSCADPISFNASCLPDGEHTVTYSSSCSCSASHPTHQTTFTTNQKPLITGIALAKTATPTIYDVTVGYSFPGTSGWQSRALSVTGIDSRGQVHHYYSADGLRPLPHIDEQNGSVTFQMTTHCNPDGEVSIVAIATACNGDTDRKTSSVMVNHRPEVHMELTNNGNGTAHVTIGYKFPDNGSLQNRSVFLRVLPTAKDPGGTYVGWDGAFGGLPPSPEGTLESDVPFDSHRILRVQAYACGDDEVHEDKGLECCSAGGPPTSVGDPVQLFDGTMTYVEHDPLPDDTGRVFTRVYKSTHSQWDGGFAFGAPWFSVFDAGIALFGPTAIVYTENDDHAVFDQLPDGSWRQSWPTGHMSRGTLSGSETAGYTYRADGSAIVRTYGANHRLTSLLDTRTQRRVVIEYDTNRRPLRVFDDAGRWSCTVSMANGKVAQISVDGRPDIVWNYAYYGNGILANVSLAGSPAPWRSYEYERHGFLPSFDYLARIRDATGAILEEHRYDDGGHALTSFGRSGDITSMRYSPAGTIVTRANGSVSTYQQTFVADHETTTHIEGGCASCGGHDTTYGFDQFGHVTRSQDGRGFVTESTYDAAGEKLIAVRRALTADGSPTAATTTTRFAYDDPNWPDRATRIEREGAAVETFTFDSVTGETLVHAVGPHVTRTTLYDGTEGAAFDPGVAFDPALPQPRGLKKTVDGPRTGVGDVTTYLYYPVGPWQSRVAAIRNAAGHITRFADYDVFGNAQTIVDPNGVVTRRTFDALGRLLTSSIDELVTSNRYANVTGPLSATIQPNGNVVAYEYDERGRVAAMSRGPSAADLRERIAYTWDASTQQKASERYLANVAGTWVEKRRESYAYDAFGRLSTITHSDGTSVTYSYDASDNLTAIQDERHSAPNTRYEYDAAKRLSSVAQTLGASEIRTEYRYDAQDNVNAVVDPNGNTTAFVFDEFSRMVRQESPFTGVSTYTYDEAGNLTSSTDGNGVTTTRTYDAMNRILTADTSTEMVAWNYDSGPFAIGRLASMSDPTGSTSYEYERRGLLTAERKTVGSALYATEYRYDANGNRDRIIYPSGRVADFAFDFADRPLSLAGVVNSAAYAPFGPMSQLAFANGTTASMQYDARYRPQENKLTGAAGVIADYVYAEDAAGNITEIRDAIEPGYNRAFGYDDLNRLVAANSGALLWGPRSYAYDPLGNMVGAPAATYDAAGNEVALGSSRYSYSPRNLLEPHGYDGRGIRTISPAPVDLASLSAPASAVGGATVMATLTLTAASAGVVVTINSDNAAALVPSSVQVVGTSATFAITTSAVATRTIATISATFGSTTKSVQLAIDPPSISSIALNPSSVTGGDSSTLTVALDAPGVVALSSDRAEAVVPPSVAVPPGTATVSTSTVSSPVIASIRASIGSSAKAASLTINPSPVTLAALTVSLEAGRVTLSAPAAAPVIVSLSSEDASVASVPSSVTVAQGALAADFPIATSTVLTPTTVVITATLGGISKTASLTLLPPASLAIYRLTIDPPNVAGGSATTGTIVLTGNASNGGAEVVLTSSATSTVIVPASVRIKNGNNSATFDIATAAVAVAETVQVSATFGGVTQKAPLTVIPAGAIGIASLQLVPATVASNGSANGVITMSGVAPAGGVLVTIATKQRNVVTVPATVIVPGGSATANFTVAAQTVHTTKTAEVAATYAGVTRTAVLTVVPASLSFTANVATLGARRIYLYTPELNLLAETEVSSAPRPPVEHEYLWFAGRPVAQFDVATNTTHYTFTDHLGTPLLQTDASGRVDWRAEYEPYGAVFSLRAGATRHQPLRFPGQEEQGELTYNVFRWYRAGWGRYTQADPLGLDAGPNLYAYAEDRPIRLTDRLGLDTAGCDDFMGTRASRCELQCCAKHDECFDKNHCTSGSMMGKPRCGCDEGEGCKRCNTDVKFCMARCYSGSDPGSSSEPLFYCAALHKYVRIPGAEFADSATAEKSCEYNYGRDCRIPLSPAKPRKPWYRRSPR